MLSSASLIHHPPEPGRRRDEVRALPAAPCAAGLYTPDALRTVDMRTDTLTMPSPDMRRAMVNAELGDDVFGEDPTVNRLQDVAAERFGKESALFVSSGTMGNLLGVLVNARSGQEIIADTDSHVFVNEGGGAASLGGIQIRTVSTPRGVMSPEQVESAIRPTDDVHQ